MNSALQEFALQGYGQSSINTICETGNISKGVLYHYFADKDAVYLTCVQMCFDALTDHLQACLEKTDEDRIQAYFDARYDFFKENPLYQRVFCDAVISPPDHLSKQIHEIKADFDALNLSVLTELLSEVKLREDVTTGQVIEVFRLFQDFINARYQMTPNDAIDIKEHEEICSRALNILLYGAVKRED